MLEACLVFAALLGALLSISFSSLLFIYPKIDWFSYSKFWLIQRADNLLHHFEDFLYQQPSVKSDINVIDPFLVRKEGKDICIFFAKCDPVYISSIVATTDPSATIAEYLKLHRPLLLPSLTSSVRAWPGFYWNLWDWAQHRYPILPSVEQLAVSQNSRDYFQSHVFTFADKRQKASSEDIIHVPDMLFWDFLTGARNESMSCRYFHSNYLKIEEISKAENETDWSSFIINNPLLGTNYSNVGVPPKLSMLYAECATQMRYFDYHTAKIQLRGSSKVVLVSPDQASKLMLFPYLHPSSRHSQIDWFQPIYERWKSARSISAQSVLLEPGDVLIIPPGWSTYYSALNLSLTLDVMSPSTEQVRLLEALSIKFPFPANVTQDKKVLYAQVFIAHVLSRIDGVTSIKKFAQRLYNSRYSLLYPENSLVVQSNTFSCFADNPTFRKQVVESMDKDMIEEYAQFIAVKFNDPKLSKGIKWMWVGNFVESVLRWLYGPKSLLEASIFMLRCLNLDGKIEIFEEVEGPPVMRLEPEEV